MNKSESIKNLAVALKKAQSEIGGVEFDSVNPFYKSKYASLGAVIKASKEVLANNGLTVSQPSVTNEYGVGVTTLLMHDSGEYIESTVTIPVTDQKNTAQEAGKAITYLRRYSLASILNLYSDEDIDGNSPQKPEKKSQPKPQNGALTLNEAAAMVGGSDGKKYGECTDEELNGKIIGITKWLNNKSNADSPNLDKYMLKLEAAKMVLNSRK
jgi:hypothetical protein